MKFIVVSLVSQINISSVIFYDYNYDYNRMNYTLYFEITYNSTHKNNP